MKKLFLIIAAISMIVLYSCDPLNTKKSDDNATLGLVALALQNQPVNLEFSVTAGGQTFESNKALTVNGVSNVTFRDLRFFVSEVALIRTDGTSVPVTLADDGVWQTKNVALLDFENGKSVTGSHGGTSTGMNSKVTGSVPAGAYKEIQFTIGVPENLNHLLPNDSKAPLNISAMYWAWASGYKHAKIEFTNQDATTTSKWTNMHLGSTGFGTSPAATACTNSITTGQFGNCPAKFRPRIAIEGTLNLANQRIVMNLDNLLKGYTHLTASDADGLGTCMPIAPTADFLRCNPLSTNLGLKGRVSTGTSALVQADLDAGVGSIDTSYKQTIFSLGQ
jgi:uncharacterized repeat protein (TIGR04052 family)